MRGFGEELLNSNANSSALGGLAVQSPRNPAYPINAVNSNVTVGALMLGSYGSDGKNNRLVGNGRPDFFRAQVPLPVGFHVGLGFSEWYNQDFAVYSESTSAYRRFVAGAGGIYDLNASLSRSFGRNAAIGLEYSGLIGSSSELWRFDAYQGNYVTYDSVNYDYHGDALRLGIMCRLPFLRFDRSSDSSVELGGFYEQVLDFGLDDWTRTHGTTSESIGRAVKFPARYGLGLTAFPAPDWKVCLEGIHQSASQITIGGSTPAAFTDALRVTLGAEYRLKEKYPLRFGLHWQNWYLKAADGTQVREIGLSAGSTAAIPGFGALDYSLEYANRNGGSLKENVLRAQLSLYFEEPWKKRTRNWGY